MNIRFGIHMGPRQVELVERVRREGLVDVTGNRTDYCSAMKLADRGILARRHFRGRQVYGAGPHLKMIS